MRPRPDERVRGAVQAVATALERSGILIRGALRFAEGEGPLLKTGEPARSVLLLGNVGGSIWQAFDAWRAGYSGPDPLDTWSKSVILPLAETVGATAYFPSDAPWQPFQRWAMQAEGLKPSPLGLLIHPRFGLWHGYRGALGFSFPLEDAQKVASGPHPCDRCIAKPCLSACPANAVSEAGFHLAACRTELRHGDRVQCQRQGCHARAACPIGAEFLYPAEQLRFHMEALQV